MDYETEHYDRLAANLASPVPAGIAVPGYELIRELNRGGQAVVFLSRQESTGRRVAVKLLAEGPLARAGERARLDREVTILAALHHPHIVSIVDRGATRDGWLYLVMEYVDGKPLDEWLDDARKSHPSPQAALDAALRVFLKICDAVNVAHLRGIVHRDLKPSNILVDAAGEPHVLDFGLARPGIVDVGSKDAPAAAVTVTGQFVGSLPWASPEQAEGVASRIDIRSDVYSLGVILYQILTGGRFPYAVTGTMPQVLQNILSAPAVPPSRVADVAPDGANVGTASRRLSKTSAAHVAPALEAIALKALAKRREERYQTAGELARDVENVLSGRRGGRAGNAPGRQFARWLIAGVVGCALALGAFWLYRDWRERDKGLVTPAATMPAPRVGEVNTVATSSPAAVTFRVIELGREMCMTLAAADLDGDGKSELLADYRLQLEVWSGGGIAGEAPTRHTALPDDARQLRTIIVADINGDSRKDVVVGEWGAAPARIAVLLNRDRNSLVRSTVLTSPAPLKEGASVAVDDFDGDGRADVLAAGNAEPFALMLWPGNGDGTFRGPTQLIDRACPQVHSLGDVGGDGRADVVTVGPHDAEGGPPRESTLVLNHRDGTQRVPLGGRPLVISAVADFNGDRRPDLVSISPHSLGHERNTLEVWLGNQTRPPLDNPYLGPRTQSEVHANSAAYAGNFDGDGKLDLLLGDFDGKHVNWDVLLGRGDGTFRPPQRIRALSVSTTQGSVPAVADFNGDGLDDIALTHENFLGVLINTTRGR